MWSSGGQPLKEAEVLEELLDPEDRLCFQQVHDGHVTHRAPERMRESSYPILAHEPPEKSDATPPSSPNVGTKGQQQSPG